MAAAADWIAKDNPLAARAFRGAVRQAAERVLAHPHFGVRRPELARGPYRFLTLTEYHYLIVYKDDCVPPIIARVVHGSRNLPRQLRELL